MKQCKFIVVLVMLVMAAAVLHAQNVTGNYKTDFGTMILQQNGTQVTGTYDYLGGRIEGTLNGFTLTGWWYQTNGKGRLIFTFNTDGSGFKGKWSYESAEPSGIWNGTRNGPAPSQFPPTASGSSVFGMVAGIYDTDFGELTIQQNGSEVSGKYTHADGRIEGTLNGNTLTGRWYQNNGKGRFIFIFDPAYTSFAGKWSYEDAEPSSPWNGKRKSGTSSSSQPTLPSAGSGTLPAPSTVQTLPPAEGTELFNNWNKAMVLDGPATATYFYLAAPATITRITNYHWNSGRGRTPGWIALKNQNGITYGPWYAIGTSGTGGAQNVNWIVIPNIMLPAGLYQVVDSDPASWSHNSGSFSCGFTSILAK